MEEQINDTSNEVVETQVDAVETFTSMLEAEESNDKPEVANEQEDEEAVEETVEEAESEEVEEESDEDEPEAERTYTVKAAGEEVEVSESELIKSYQLGTDYTKKSQALAAQSKVVQEHANKIQESMQLRDEYAQKLGQIEQLLNEEDSSEEDLAYMKENDPVGYAVQIASKTENARKLDVLRQEQGRVMQLQQRDRQQQLSSVVAHEQQKLSELIPEFSDKVKGEQVKKDIRSYGNSMGFTDQEMSQVYDSRHVLMLNKAMKYDKLMKGKGKTKKQVSSAPRMVKRKGKIAGRAADSYDKQRARLKSSGNQSDAVSVFENILKGN